MRQKKRYEYLAYARLERGLNLPERDILVMPPRAVGRATGPLASPPERRTLNRKPPCATGECADAQSRACTGPGPLWQLVLLALFALM